MRTGGDDDGTSLKAGLKITRITFMGPPWRVEWGASSRALVKAFGGAEPIGLLMRAGAAPPAVGQGGPKAHYPEASAAHDTHFHWRTIQLQCEQRLNPKTPIVSH